MHNSYPEKKKTYNNVYYIYMSLFKRSRKIKLYTQTIKHFVDEIKDKKAEREREREKKLFIITYIK